MLALLLHGNLQYAEIPKAEIGRVIERAYVPVLFHANPLAGVL